MKKTQFAKPEYSVAMSLETGCIVMTKKGPQGVEVMGSITREDSLKFAQDIIDWVPEVVQEKPKPPTLTLVN